MAERQVGFFNTVTPRQEDDAGKLKDQTYDEGELAMSLAGLPAVAG